MSRNNTLIGFDFDRGDKLSILRECAIDLSKQKREFAAVVLVNLIIDYFAADSNCPMPEITAEDPLVVKLFGDLKKADENVRDIIIGQMNGALSRYIEHQRVNARDEFFRRAGNAINAWKQHHPGEDVPKEYLELIGAFGRATKTNVTDLVDRANAHAKGANAHAKGANAHAKGVNAHAKGVNATDKNKREISSSDKLESLSISKNVGPSGVANVAPPGGGTFARTATDDEGRTYREEDFAIDPVRKIMAYVHEREEVCLAPGDADKDVEMFRGALLKRAKVLAPVPGAFVSVCFDIVSECCEALRVKYSPENYDQIEGVITGAGKAAEKKEAVDYGEEIRRTIIGRLNRVIDTHGLATK